MNTPAEHTQVAHLSIDKLFPSPTNPRKRFDPAKLRELANSITAVGIAQPLLVRAYDVMNGNPPHSKTFDDMQGSFEIVAGERRYRAAALAKLDEVPCFIRSLTNQQVLHIQLIENLQRDDLHPIEEAEGYERLLKEQDADGKPYTVDSIAAEIGKSRSYIFQRRKLLDLCQDARDAFYEGKLDASTALLIARIPVEKLQLEALQKITQESGWDNQFLATGDKMTFRRARALVQDEFMLDLGRAMFNPADATLMPKAGSCTDCPKRTGNSPDLFDDVKDGNVCTDTVCFGMKKTAHVLALQKAAEDEGAEVLKGKAAKKLISNQWGSPEGQLRDHGYATLDTPVPDDAQHRTLAQVIADSGVKVQKTVVANPNREGQMIETVNIEAATKALREAGVEITLKGKTEQPQQNAGERAAAAKKRDQERTIENAYRSRLFDALHTKLEADMLDPASNTWPAIYRRLAVHLFSEYQDMCGVDIESVIALMRHYTTLPEKIEGDETDWDSHITEFQDNIQTLTSAQHLMLIAEIPLLMNEITAGHYHAEAKTMQELADEIGIDAAGLRKEIATEIKKAEAAAKKAAGKPTKKATKESEPADAPTSTFAAAKVRPAAMWPFPEPMRKGENK